MGTQSGVYTAWNRRWLNVNRLNQRRIDANTTLCAQLGAGYLSYFIFISFMIEFNVLHGCLHCSAPHQPSP